MPLYRQLADIIKEKVYSGEFSKDQRIPTETELMEAFSVSRITVRSAIDQLVEQGILVKIPGKGTFITEKKMERHLGAGRIWSFSESVRAHGDVPGAKLLGRELVMADREDAAFFRVEEGTRLICIRRLRTINGIPSLIETNHFTMHYSGLLSEDMEGSLYNILETKYQVVPRTGVRSFEIARATADEAAILGDPVGVPMLISCDLCYDEHEQPIHNCRQVIRGEKFKYYIYV